MSLSIESTNQITLSTIEELDQVSIVEETLLDSLAYLDWYKQTDLNYREMVSASLKFKYRPYQSQYAAMACLRNCNLLGYNQGVGKQQPVSEPVLTPDGWKTMGDLKTGDYVIGSSGQPILVKAVYPQVDRRVFTVTFSDGSTVRCGADHLWAVNIKREYGPMNRINKNCYKTLTTQEILNSDLKIQKGTRNKYSLPEFQGLIGEKSVTYAYALGYVLGNGSVNSACLLVSCDNRICLDVKNKLHVSLGSPSNYRLTSKNGGQFNYSWTSVDPEISKYRNAGSSGTRQLQNSDNWLTWDKQSRLNLLHGLMDSDGSCYFKDSGSVKITFTSTNEYLINLVTDLVRSLGGRVSKAHVEKRSSRYKTGYCARINLRGNFSMFSIESVNYSRVNFKSRLVEKGNEIYISGITKEDYEEDSVCIAVDSEDHLYVTSNFKLTHNTTIAGLAIKSIYSIIDRPRQIHITVPNGLAASRWLEDLGLLFDKTRFEYVVNEQQLHESTAQIIIYNHDFPKRRAKIQSAVTPKYLSGYLNKLYKPAFLIVDEIHALSNPTSDRYHHLFKVRNSAKRVLGLTGTLIDGKLESIDQICKFIYRELWPYRQNDFVNYYGDKRLVKSNYQTGDGEGNRYLNNLNLQKIAEYYYLIRRFVHRLTLSEPQVSNYITLPESNVKVTICTPSLDQRETYNSYLQEHRLQLQSISSTTSSQYQAKVLGLLYPLIKTVNVGKYNSNTNKVEALLNILKEHSKTVIFCNHIESAEYLMHRLSLAYSEGSVVQLHSKLKPTDRLEVVTAFQYEPSIKVGIFSSNLAAEAIDLTSADSVVFYCLPWSSLKVQQAIARVVRPGNRHGKVGVHYLATNGCIDKHQLNLIQEKLRVANMAQDFDEIGEDVYDRESEVDINPNQALFDLLNNLI